MIIRYLDFPCPGDTFPVGCKPGQSVVFVEDSFLGNPDLEDGRYNTELGMYQPGCGIENLLMSWGHDEYLYQVTSQYNDNDHTNETSDQVVRNHMAKAGTAIPDGGLWAIRFHSCYPWHAGGDYKHLESDKDQEILKWVLEFK